MDTNPNALASAAILNAAWHVRACRTFQRERRRKALSIMADAVQSALDQHADPEAVLYAVAVGLYDQRDQRFSV